MAELVSESSMLRRKAEQAVRLALEISDREAREGLLNYAQGLIEHAKALEVAAPTLAPTNGANQTTRA